MATRFQERIWRLTRGRRPGRRRGLTRREGVFTILLRWLARLIFGFVAVSLAVVLLFRVVNPPTTLLMVMESWRLDGVSQEWRPLQEISPEMRRAAIAAEDARFCEHRGFDLPALRQAAAQWRAGGRLYGASTISQQTAKNVFLWPSRSLIRKAFEFWFTALIEIFWSKERILEVYLNVAEFGPGVFGVEQGARRAYGISASALDVERAGRLAAVLPAPRRLDPNNLPPERRARALAVTDGALTLKKTGAAGCVVE